MRLAYLVLAHAYPEQLKRLIGRLTHEQADFYIHVDLKTDITPFMSIASSNNNVQFVTDRVRVNWGGYTIVQATLNGIKEILASGKQYDYITLLSGQDYPIKTTAAIHSFFAAHPGKVFMHTLSVTDEWREAIPRITKYHLPDMDFPGKHAVLGMINTLAPVRKFPFSMTPVGRSQWFTITPQCAAYIVTYMETHPEVARFFRRSWAPDEMVFQTILYNSPYQKDMVNDNLVYVDWSQQLPSPKTLTMADAAVLAASDKLFARKFNPEIDTEILGHLDKMTATA